eukprot:gene2485-2860_t
MNKKEFEELFSKSVADLESRLKKSFKTTIKEEIELLVSPRLSAIDVKLKEIEKSQSFLADQYETFRNQIGHLLADNTQIKAENEKLVARVRVLEKENKLRMKAIDDLEQYGRREMVEISGIPRQAKENCEGIVLNLASKINIDLKAEDIDACHRISAKPDAPIIAKFGSRKKCALMLSKQAKSYAKKCKIADLGFEMPPQSRSTPNDISGKVFINESLTSRNKNLLRLAKIKKRELDYKFVWTRNGTVFLRKEESSPTIKIAFLEDLEKLDA